MGQGRIQGWGGPVSTMLLMGTIFSQFRTSSTTIIPTLYTGSQKSKTCEKIASYRHLVKTLKLRAKNSTTNCLKICARNTKMAIIECKISKIFQESMPPNPLKPLLTSFCFKLTQSKNPHSKMSNFGALPLKKFWLRSWHENNNFK